MFVVPKFLDDGTRNGKQKNARHLKRNAFQTVANDVLSRTASRWVALTRSVESVTDAVRAA